MELDFKSAKQYMSVLCIIAFIMIACDAWAAPSNNPTAITTVLCNVVTTLQGPVGKGIATIALVVLGIGLFIGKLSWPVALATAVGIGIIFGAPQLVTWLAPQATAQACVGS